MCTKLYQQVMKVSNGIGLSTMQGCRKDTTTRYVCIRMLNLTDSVKFKIKTATKNHYDGFSAVDNALINVHKSTAEHSSNGNTSNTWLYKIIQDFRFGNRYSSLCTRDDIACHTKSMTSPVWMLSVGQTACLLTYSIYWRLFKTF